MKTTRMLYGGTIFLAAFLLFLVEPMAAKQLLPAFGGSAAVWLTCLVFFQTALLAGYTYAHWAAQACRPAGADGSSHRSAAVCRSLGDRVVFAEWNVPSRIVASLRHDLSGAR